MLFSLRLCPKVWIHTGQYSLGLPGSADLGDYTLVWNSGLGSLHCAASLRNLRWEKSLLKNTSAFQVGVLYP